MFALLLFASLFYVSSAAKNTCAGWVGGLECRVGRGTLPDSTLNLTEVVWVGPENKQIYVGSPSIARVPNTEVYISSHDFFFNTLNVTVQVFSSAGSRGVGEWKYTGNVSGLYWANLFPHGDYIYMMGVSQGDDKMSRGVSITRSKDFGKTWETPAILFPAIPGKLFYHCAPTPTLLSTDGRLYRAFEVNHDYSGALIVSTKDAVSDDTDLMDPSVWRSSSIETLSEAMIPSTWGNKTKFGWQEGNAVEMNGEVYDILRVDGQTNQTYNKAALLKLDSESNVLTFQQMIDFPSTSSKFVIRYDQTSGHFYTLSNNVTPEARALGTIYARNHLVLARSTDLVHWDICKTLLQDDTGFGPIDSARFTGFHYVDWIFDEGDILYAVRTGYRGSNSFHNANRMTMKREYNFRSSC
jgi:hypothetical protein|eukprot:g1041.t1